MATVQWQDEIGGKGNYDVRFCGKLNVIDTRPPAPFTLSFFDSRGRVYKTASSGNGCLKFSEPIDFSRVLVLIMSINISGGFNIVGSLV